MEKFRLSCPLRSKVNSLKSVFAIVFFGFLIFVLCVSYITSPYVFGAVSFFPVLLEKSIRSNFTRHPAVIRNVTDVSYVYKVENVSETTRDEETTTAPVVDQSRPVQVCVHPQLVESDPVMMKFVKKPSMPECSKEEWLYVDNGTVRFSDPALKKFKSFQCDYYPLKRASESKSVFEEPIRNISNGFKMVSDFFKGVCTSVDGANNTAVYSGVHHNEHRARRSQNADPLELGFKGLSIAILGFDSMSRMSWLRRLKKTRKYFHDTMKGIELTGHNIVGDGTTAVILPMLTGKFEWELPECRFSHSFATTMDKFPFIWRDMEQAGYLTSWCNADPYSAAFNWRMHGFLNTPTDFYMRPFYLAVRKRADKTRGNCDEGHTTSRLWLRYFRDIFHMYPHQRKFLFHFITDFSHDDNNGIMKMDDDIADVVKHLHEKNYLNNTLLILMGDHGARYPASVRASWQGKMEERLPYFGFAFPPWFEKLYPHAVNNLRVNTARLTTPFDIHETFKDFLHFGGTGKGDLFKRGISLFKEIPLERSCQAAGVAVHWCACMDWKNASSEDAGVQRAARAVVDTINNFTAAYRTDCELLTVASVDMVSKLEPRQEVLSFKKERLEDRQVDLSGHTTNGLTLYQLTVTMQPGGGKFEVTVSHNLINDKLSISDKEISRINMYGDDPKCILNKNKSIRAYCYCKSKSNSNVKS